MADHPGNQRSESFGGFLKRRFHLDTPSGRRTAWLLVLVCVGFDIYSPPTVLLDIVILALLHAEYKRESRPGQR